MEHKAACIQRRDLNGLQEAWKHRQHKEIKKANKESLAKRVQTVEN